MSITVIYDLDGTLVKESDGLLKEPFLRFMHEQVLRHEPGLSWDDFRRISEKMLKEHGSSVTGWQLHLKQDAAWNHSMFRNAAPILADAVIAGAKPNEHLLIELERQRTRGFELAIMTHSHDEYAHKLARAFGFDTVIEPGHIFGMDRIQGLKLESRVYEYVLREMGGKAYDRRMMVENTHVNLVQARANGFRIALTNAEKPDNLELDVHHMDTVECTRAITAFYE